VHDQPEGSRTQSLTSFLWPLRQTVVTNWRLPLLLWARLATLERPASVQTMNFERPNSPSSLSS